MRFEEFLTKELDCKSVKSAGGFGGGCISQGQAYEITEKDGSKRNVFVKRNSDRGVRTFTSQTRIKCSRQISLKFHKVIEICLNLKIGAFFSFFLSPEKLIEVIFFLIPIRKFL